MSKILVILHSCFYWIGRPVHLRIILNKETVTVPEEGTFFLPQKEKMAGYISGNYNTKILKSVL